MTSNIEGGSTRYCAKVWLLGSKGPKRDIGTPDACRLAQKSNANSMRYCCVNAAIRIEK